MTGTELLFSLVLVVVVVSGLWCALAVRFETLDCLVSVETAAKVLIGSTVLAVLLVSLLKFVRMEG